MREGGGEEGRRVAGEQKGWGSRENESAVGVSGLDMVVWEVDGLSRR